MSAPTEDPTRVLLRRIWKKIRIPVLTLFGVSLVIGQWDLLTSGDAFRVLTGVMTLVFWATLLLRVGKGYGDMTSAEGLRERARSDLKFWGPWLLVGIAWLVWGQTHYDLRPGAYLVVVLPVLVLTASFFTYTRADRLAERIRANAATSLGG